MSCLFNNNQVNFFQESTRGVFVGRERATNGNLVYIRGKESY